AVVELLKVLLKARAEEAGVASKLIATVSDLEQIANDDDAPVAALKGWRREAFGEDALHRRGTIEGRNTVSDYHEIEQERGNSVFATPLHTEWRDYKINIIDTPGFDDFAGEMISSIRVADTCVMVINAQ